MAVLASGCSDSHTSSHLGYKVLHGIQAHTAAGILVVSALADKATAIQALKEGAMGFLCKPFSEDDLCDAIDEMLRGDE